MSDQLTVTRTTRDGTDSGSATSLTSGSSFSDLAPEIQGDLYRRLGGVALVYSGAWLANYAYYHSIHRAAQERPETYWHVIAWLCMAGGLGVYLLCRRRLIPPGLFQTFAATFEVLGAIGIMSGWLGWETNGNELMTRLGGTFGIPPDEIARQVTEPLARDQIRIFYHDGVPWVAIWLLAFPLVVPASTGRTVVATLLAASVVPVFLVLSLLVNGVPDSLAPWVAPYIQEASVSTFIVAGIAVFSSRVVYKLTRDLSHARRMGSYQLVEKIGQGGMGEVWKARHRMLVRPAAIKLVRAKELEGEGASAHTARQRFRREAQATSELSSPHSIELYDFGIAEDGTFYYVMELLEGIDLKRLVEKHGPVPAERAIHILRQACHSLHDAHLTGVVHRDIKPGNIFVCRSGFEYDFVKVLDFGLVKQLHSTGSLATQLTVEGIASGTPAFMAPEMAHSDRPVDGRADLYALGCVGYWLLTGTLVFEGDSPMSVLVQHVRDVPPPLSVRTEISVPADLERIILSCLEKDPDARPRTARSLADQLDACRRSLPDWSEERSTRWWETNLPQFTRARDEAARSSVGAVPTP